MTTSLDPSRVRAACQATDIATRLYVPQSDEWNKAVNDVFDLIVGLAEQYAAAPAAVAPVVEFRPAANQQVQMVKAAFPGAVEVREASARPAASPAPPTAAASPQAAAVDSCPKCGGNVWDNREKKAAGGMNPKAPDFSCRDRDGCGWVKWPERKK